MHRDEAILMMEYDHLYLEISLFIHFMVKIIFYGSKSVHTVTSFKILNDITIYITLDL